MKMREGEKNENQFCRSLNLCLMFNSFIKSQAKLDFFFHNNKSKQHKKINTTKLLID